MLPVPFPFFKKFMLKPEWGVYMCGEGEWSIRNIIEPQILVPTALSPPDHDLHHTAPPPSSFLPAPTVSRAGLGTQGVCPECIQIEVGKETGPRTDGESEERAENSGGKEGRQGPEGRECAAPPPGGSVEGARAAPAP